MFRYKASYLIEKLKDKKNIDVLLKNHFSNYQLPYSNIKDSLLSVRWHQQALLDELAQECEVDFDTFLQEQQPYLNTKQINEMIADGFTFGSHSQNHPTYKKLTLDEQITQTLLSQEFTSNNFALNYKVFAFPFTDISVSKAFFDRILDKEDFQLTFGGAGLKHELIKGQLQRFGMENSYLKTARKMIHTEICYYIIKSLFRKNIIRRI